MTTQPLALSVLDLIPVERTRPLRMPSPRPLRSPAGPTNSASARYWVAEHHNMPSVASTNPPVLIGILAGQHRAHPGRIRRGHAAQPRAAGRRRAVRRPRGRVPGRIDLGLGRAPGSDPVITAVLRHSGNTSDVDMFPDNIRDIQALLHPDGAALRMSSGHDYELRATPHAGSVPDVWLLGSSDYSAQPCRPAGLPYVFAHHFSGEGTQRALDLYRSGFQPSEALAAAAHLPHRQRVRRRRAEEAYAFALPQLQHMARLRTGQKLTALDTVEDAATAVTDAAAARQGIAHMARPWIIDEPVAAAARIRELAERFGVDEVMISPAASARAADDPRTARGGCVRWNCWPRPRSSAV